MRISTIVVFLLLSISASLMAQSKVIVTSTGKTIHLQDGMSSERAVRRAGLLPDAPAGNCDNSATSFGYPLSAYPVNNPFNGYHKDTWGAWFICPASGTIDSFYFVMHGTNDMQDSIAKIRIFKSALYPGHGPGYGTYNPPRHGWGYYVTEPTH